MPIQNVALVTVPREPGVNDAGREVPVPLFAYLAVEIPPTADPNEGTALLPAANVTPVVPLQTMAPQ